MKNSARINVCTSYCNVGTMTIGFSFEKYICTFFRFLPSDENWAKYSLQMDNCALFVTIIPSIDRFVIASKSMILYKINLMYDFLRDITIFLAGFLKWIELHNNSDSIKEFLKKNIFYKIISLGNILLFHYLCKFQVTLSTYNSFANN